MNRLRQVVPCALLLLGLAGSAAAQQAAPKPGADAKELVAPVAQAEALAMAMADAVEKSADCRALGPNLDAAVAAHSADVRALSAAQPVDSGSVGADEQKRLLAMAKKVKGCAGQVKSRELENLKTALAAYGRKSKPTKLASSSWCKENCCIKGWETWAAVAFFSAACAVGDNQACCLAVTIASYDACVDLYCPTNDCCQDIDPGGPPHR